MIFRPYPPKIHKQISVPCKETTGNRRNLSGKILRLSGWNAASIFRMLFRCFSTRTGRHFFIWVISIRETMLTINEDVFEKFSLSRSMRREKLVLLFISNSKSIITRTIPCLIKMMYSICIVNNDQTLSNSSNQFNRRIYKNMDT